MAQQIKYSALEHYVGRDIPTTAEQDLEANVAQYEPFYQRLNELFVYAEMINGALENGLIGEFSKRRLRKFQSSFSSTSQDVKRISTIDGDNIYSEIDESYMKRAEEISPNLKFHLESLLYMKQAIERLELMEKEIGDSINASKGELLVVPQGEIGLFAPRDLAGAVESLKKRV